MHLDGSASLKNVPLKFLSIMIGKILLKTKVNTTITENLKKQF